MPPRYCPQCNADISDNYEGSDAAIGILLSGWYCYACDEFVEEDEDDGLNGEFDD